MSKRNLERDNSLPKHQKKIVLCLAKHGAMIMSETNRKLKGENTSTTRAFHELENKGIVSVVGKETYKGREFSKYWLTNKGIAYALLNGANPESTKNNAMRFSKDKMIGSFFEFRSLSPEMQNLLDHAMLRIDKTIPLDLIVQSLFAGISMENPDLKKVVDAIRKSGIPESVLANLKEIRKSIEALEEMLVKSEQGKHEPTGA